MRIEIKRSAQGWDVVEGDLLVTQAPTRRDAIERAMDRVRSTGQLLQVIAEPDRALDVAECA